jgi:hypothetical protein
MKHVHPPLLQTATADETSLLAEVLSPVREKHVQQSTSVFCSSMVSSSEKGYIACSVNI